MENNTFSFPGVFVIAFGVGLFPRHRRYRKGNGAAARFRVVWRNYVRGKGNPHTLNVQPASYRSEYVLRFRASQGVVIRLYYGYLGLVRRHREVIDFNVVGGVAGVGIRIRHFRSVAVNCVRRYFNFLIYIVLYRNLYFIQPVIQACQRFVFFVLKAKKLRH